MKLFRELELWHPDSPGGRVLVRRYWPRYLWTPGPGADGRPRAFATLGEVRAVYARAGIGQSRRARRVRRRARADR